VAFDRSICVKFFAVLQALSLWPNINSTSMTKNFLKKASSLLATFNHSINLHQAIEINHLIGSVCGCRIRIKGHDDEKYSRHLPWSASHRHPVHYRRLGPAQAARSMLHHLVLSSIGCSLALRFCKIEKRGHLAAGRGFFTELRFFLDMPPGKWTIIVCWRMSFLAPFPL